MSATTASPVDAFNAAYATASDVWSSSVSNVEFMATNAQNYNFAGAMSSTKATVSGSTDYYLSWVSQVNAQTAPTAANWLQQWVAPKWSVANVYVNYVCQIQGSGANGTQFVRDTGSSLGAAMATGAYTKINTQGTSVSDANTVHSQSALGTDGSWSTWSCSGVRKAGASDSNISAFAVGDTVTYAAAFRYSAGAQAQSPINGAYFSSEDLTYTVVEKTDLAVALTVGAASVSAIAALAF